MNKLYEITNKFIELFEKGENEELTQEELQEQGQELALTLQDKADSIVKYKITQDDTIASLKAEIERLTAIKKTIEKREENFKEYVKINMEKLGLKKIETPFGNLTVASNPASVEILNESDIPDTYFEEVITRKLDKKKLLADLKNGEIIEGVRLNNYSTNLRIK